MKVSDSGIIAAGDLRPHDADAPCQIERYIASRRHIHRIAIATQEAAFATRLRLQISNGFVADRDLWPFASSFCHNLACYRHSELWYLPRFLPIFSLASLSFSPLKTKSSGLQPTAVPN